MKPARILAPYGDIRYLPLSTKVGIAGKGDGSAGG
jgi:hypothetical protein